MWTLLPFSGHKFYSIKGAGFLYAKKGSYLSSLIHGGGQERHRRGGTENTLGIGALGVAAKRISLVEEKIPQMTALRDHMEKRILAEIEGSHYHRRRDCASAKYKFIGPEWRRWRNDVDVFGYRWLCSIDRSGVLEWKIPSQVPYY